MVGTAAFLPHQVCGSAHFGMVCPFHEIRKDTVLDSEWSISIKAFRQLAAKLSCQRWSSLPSLLGFFSEELIQQ